MLVSQLYLWPLETWDHRVLEEWHVRPWEDHEAKVSLFCPQSSIAPVEDEWIRGSEANDILSQISLIAIELQPILEEEYRSRSEE